MMILFKASRGNEYMASGPAQKMHYARSRISVWSRVSDEIGFSLRAFVFWRPTGRLIPGADGRQ